MRLVSFRIRNFRSINDSGGIRVEQLTALLGRNGSGKSNLLRGLESLNPAAGLQPLNAVKDFPRHRRLEECDDNTPVVDTRWQLERSEQQALGELWPRAKDVQFVSISRRYGKTRYIGFEGLGGTDFDVAEIKARVRKVVPAVKAAADKLEGASQESLNAAADTFESAMAVGSDPLVWGRAAKAACANLRKALAAVDADLSTKQEAILDELEGQAETLLHDDAAAQKARSWAVEQLPIFVYVDDYPELHGHQNIDEYLNRKRRGELKSSDRNFEKLCKVAALDPEELQRLHAENEHETRNQLANRASAVVTTEIRRLWRDRSLKVRFNLDAAHLNTFISDPNATYDVEVNLDDRSRGFQWFFSFYITFAADTRGGNAENAVLLLDEPGLYLHARSQGDLLGHFENDFTNQIIYTTHSPFMVPTHLLTSVRTVSIDEKRGTTVTNDPTGDERTLFPLQAALGYDIAQSLFVGPNNLVVEGVTDFWLLSAASTYMQDLNKECLAPDITITPAGGAQKVSYMVALLSAQRLNVLVLLDQERDAQATRDELVKSKLISGSNVVFVSEAFSPPKGEADIEDILGDSIYQQLVIEAYAKELNGRVPKFNDNIPRVAKRAESALRELDIPFHKTRPARLLLAKASADPRSVITDDAVSRFEALFRVINQRMKGRAANKLS